MYILEWVFIMLVITWSPTNASLSVMPFSNEMRFPSEEDCNAFVEHVVEPDLNRINNGSKESFTAACYPVKSEAY
jgi:hypothetical protein